MEAQEAWFWKNCRAQRQKPAKICLVCPFIDYKTGKRKLPEGKPPLIEPSTDEDAWLCSFEEGAKAQRDSDIKWYRGE